MGASGNLSGMNWHDEGINMGGIPGAFGAEKGFRIYSNEQINDPNYQANRAMVAARIAEALGQRPTEMQTGYSDQWRAKQMGLSDQLQGVVNGTAGPSVAQQQLDQATNANNMAAASTAASSSQYGMDPAAAFKAALNQQAMNNQQAAGQAGLLRANEVAAARGQMAGLFDSARGADINTAQSQMSAEIQQREQLQQYVTQLMQMGYTEDQANYMARVQQQQFQQGSLAQQEAAKQGISTSNSAQGVQFGSTVVGGLLGGASAALGKPTPPTPKAGG
jgi:hypothetical protein